MKSVTSDYRSDLSRNDGYGTCERASILASLILHVILLCNCAHSTSLARELIEKSV